MFLIEKYVQVSLRKELITNSFLDSFETIPLVVLLTTVNFLKKSLFKNSIFVNFYVDRTYAFGAQQRKLIFMLDGR